MISTALRNTLQQGYNLSRLHKDGLAGITVGIVAIPLSMGLAIASGVAPEYGLYTAIVAGLLISLTGGSHVNISGPTAAFVVILLPITEKYGAGGLAIATLMAGLILVIMGLCRLGKLISYVPYPITIGFTTGIAVVIASLQLKNFFGLHHVHLPENFFARMGVIITSLPDLNIWDTLTAVVTLGTFLGWKQLKTTVPPHLPALIAGAGTSWLATHFADHAAIATIGSQFSWHVNGLSGSGIPPVAPQFILPWNLPDASGQPIGINFDLVHELMTSAIAIALLGALESLLCAVVADGMARTRHHSNGELIGQGLGNIVAPFFGGIPATAAIARTATSVRSGATSPIASFIHGLFVLAALLLLAPLLSDIPMASLAALLLMVAWNMSEAHHFVRILRIAPKEDIAVLLTCFSLTVVFDMVVAVIVGMLLAGLLLIKRISAMSTVKLSARSEPEEEGIDLPDTIKVYDINGPLFFGAAQKALSVLQKNHGHTQVIILNMANVHMLDMTALVSVENILLDLQKSNIGLVLNEVQPRLLLKMRKAGIRKQKNNIAFGRNMKESAQQALSLLMSRQ